MNFKPHPLPLSQQLWRPTSMVFRFLTKAEWDTNASKARERKLPIQSYAEHQIVVTPSAPSLESLKSAGP